MKQRNLIIQYCLKRHYNRQVYQPRNLSFRLQGLVFFPYLKLLFLFGSPTLFSHLPGFPALLKQEDEIANILLKKKIILLLFVYQILQIGH